MLLLAVIKDSRIFRYYCACTYIDERSRKLAEKLPRIIPARMFAAISCSVIESGGYLYPFGRMFCTKSPLPPGEKKKTCHLWPRLEQKATYLCILT